MRNEFEQRHAETLVREFLVFRGFTQSLRAFDGECALDLSQGYQVDKIMELLFTVYVPRFEIDKLVELMDFLGRTLFSPADVHSQVAARKLDASLKKYYIVHAIQKGRVDRVLHFFEEHGASLLQSGGEEWQPWFSIPYVRNPSTDPRFQVYFSKEWLDTLMVSLRNFLSQFFDGIRLPLLIKLMSKRSDYKSLKQELKVVQAKYSLLEATLQEKESEILQLKQALLNSPSIGILNTTLSKDAETITTDLSAENTDVNVSFEIPPHEASGKRKFTSFISSNTGDDAATWPNDDHIFTEVSTASQENFSGHTGAVTRCRFSPTGSNIASGSTDGTVRIWACDSNASTSRNATIYCGVEVLSLDWEHKAGRLLLLGTADRAIKAWNVDAKRVVCDLSTNSEFPRVLDMRCSPTEPVFVSAESSTDSSFGSLTLWNMRSWKPLNVLPLGEDPPVVTSICFNHNGKMLAAAASDGVIRLFDMNGCLQITGWPAHDGSVSCVRFAPNQTSIFTTGSDGKVLEWSLHNQGQILQSFNASKFTTGCSKFLRHEMALASQGNSLLLTSDLDYAPLFDFGGEPKALKTLQHGGPVTSVDWHPHLNMYLTGSADHSIHVTSIM